MNKGWYRARDWNNAVLGNVTVIGRRGSIRNKQGILRAVWDCSCKCGKCIILDSQALHQKEVRGKRGVVGYCTMFCKMRG